MTLHETAHTPKSDRTTLALRDRDVHFALRRVALERRMPLQALVSAILRDWLVAQGEVMPTTEADGLGIDQATK